MYKEREEISNNTEMDKFEMNENDIVEKSISNDTNFNQSVGNKDLMSNDVDKTDCECAEDNITDTAISNELDTDGSQLVVEKQTITNGANDEITNPQAVDTSDKKVLRTRILKTILLLLFFGATFYTIYAVSKTLSGGNIASLKEVLSTPNPLYMAMLFVIVGVIFLTDASKYAVASKITMGKFDYRFNIGVGVMGRFYDNITPFNTGGQPYQVYQYYKRGYPVSVSTVIPLVKYMFELTTRIIVCLVLYIVNHNVLDMLPSAQATAVASLTYVGIAIASFGPATLILFSLFPKAINKIIRFVLKLGYKLHIVKDFDKKSEEVLEFLTNYSKAFKQVAGNFKGIVSMFAVSTIDSLLVMSVPFFVIIALGKTTPSMELFWDMVTLNAYSFFAASLVPTPGNSGAIEGVASMAFAPMQMADGALFWVVFIWRICTYYIYIVLGLIKTFVDFVKNRITKRKMRNGN